MKAKELMTKTVFSVRRNQNLYDAAKLMWEHDCGWLPVLDDEGKVLAAITDRDIAMAAFINGQALSDIPLSKAQSRSIISCRESDDIEDVEAIMQTSQVRRIPIVDRNSIPVGVLSLNDIAIAYQAKKKGVAAEDLSRTLSAICSHSHPQATVAAVG